MTAQAMPNALPDLYVTYSAAGRFDEPLSEHLTYASARSAALVFARNGRNNIAIVRYEFADTCPGVSAVEAIYGETPEVAP
jgi:hypothetical protein